MKIYLVSTRDSVGYDEYEAVVVVAKSAKDAVSIAKEECDNFSGNLDIISIGAANKRQKRGAVLTAFNAA
jgi:hypothetical protein